MHKTQNCTANEIQSMYIKMIKKNTENQIERLYGDPEQAWMHPRHNS